MMFVCVCETRPAHNYDELSFCDIKAALNSNMGHIPVHTKVESDLIESAPDLKMSDLM